jgi:protein-S-isoprenylcysteine O-methyltransferase Ste14
MAAYGGLSYLLFLGSFAYFIAFVGGIVVPRTVDSGLVVPVAEALAVNLGLLMLFGVQHSGMARRSFKRWWTRLIPPPAERSTYVLVSSLIHMLIIWQWRPMPGVIWHVEHPLGEAVLWGLFALGWGIGIATTFLISHAELFGLQQVWAKLRRRSFHPPAFQTPLFYRIVRHPMQAGIALGLWATPYMTIGHALLAAGLTAYILIGIHYEERDLVRRFGAEYDAYRERVPGKIIPRPVRKPAPSKAA